MVKGTHQAIDDVRNETVKIFINGEFHDRREAKISVFDSGYLVGDGVWEAFRVHQGKLIFIDQHLDRLWQSAKVIGIDIPFSKEELINNVHRTLKINGMKNDVHVRAMLTRGIKKRLLRIQDLLFPGPTL